MLLVADPYSGGTKGQSLTMAAPLFLEGELVLFPAIRAQMIDLAGEYPGGFHPDSLQIIPDFSADRLQLSIKNLSLDHAFPPLVAC